MPDLIPAGYYRAVAVPVDTDDGPTYVQFGESSKGTSQAVVNFEILDGECAGRRIVWFGYFSEKTVTRTVESLRYCGFKGDDLAALLTQTLDQEVQLVIQHEDYQGTTSAKVAWVNRAGGGGFKLKEPMQKAGLQRFAAMMKNSVKAIPEAPGPKGERGAKPTPDQHRDVSSADAPASSDNDGIPF